MDHSKQPPDPGAQDTPGRPKPASSRQQTQHGQGSQSGSPQLDSKDTGKGPQREAAVRYQDRPANEGRHGDADEEPTPGPLATDTRRLK